jgi:glycerol-3-phosphate O-acyltransferase
VRLDRYKLMTKAFVEAELMGDPDVNRRIVAHAQAEGRSVMEVREDVETWIDEIVPFFNLTSYFKLGQGVARAALGAIYDVVIDRTSIERLHRQLPQDAVLVYVMNHRSNADYVLVAYMLRHQIALSYAVGEWARVWPLESLFKSFGSYFIRRRFRNELYHFVLEKYVQLISRRGVTQGFFPEGGLSRDGLLREPKIGLLAYIVGIKADPAVREEVYFIPVGINYDWVLEDRALLEELAGKRKGPVELAGKLLSLLFFLGRVPFTLLVNLGRLAFGRLKRHGYASASFGDPIPLSPWLEERPELRTADREARKPHLQSLARELMQRIGAVVPVTPVPVVCRALLDLGAGEVGRDDLLRRVHEIREALRARGARFVEGREFAGAQAGRERLEAEREDRRPELWEVEQELIGWDEAKATVRVALDLLRSRRLVKVRAAALTVRAGAEPLLRYYASSIAQLLAPEG